MSFALTSARGEVDIGVDKSMSNLRQLGGGLTALDAATGTTGGKMSALGAATGQVTTQVSTMDKVMRAATGAATLLGVAVASVFAKGLVTGMAYEKQLSSIQAVSGATASQMKQLDNLALDLGQSTSKTATEIGGAIEILAKNGISIENILTGAAAGVVALSLATGTSVQTAADVVSVALTQFSLGGDQATYVADLFTRAANKTRADVGDLGQAFAYAAGTAANLNIPIEETTAAIAVLADAGLDGTRGGTALTEMLNRMVAPTGAAQTAMDKLGVSFKDANGEFIGIGPAITQVKTRLDALGVGAAEQQNILKDIFGEQGTNAVLAFLKTTEEGAKAAGKSWEDYVASMTEGAGAAEQAGVRLDNLSGDVEQLTGTLETMQIKVFKFLSPALREATQGVTAFLQALLDLPAPIQKIIGLVTAMVSIFGLLKSLDNPFLRMIPGADKLFPVLTRLAGPLALLTGGLAILGFAYKKNFGGIRDWAEGVQDKFKSIKNRYNELVHSFGGESARNAILGFDDTAPMDDFLGKLHAIGIAIEEFTGIDMKKWLQDFGKGLLRFPKAVRKIADGFSDLSDTIKDRGLIAGIKSVFGANGRRIIEGFGDTVAAVPKLFGDMISGISTGNKRIDGILDQVGRSFTDFGRLIQELGQGDLSGFMDVLGRLGGRLGDLALDVGGLILDGAVSLGGELGDLFMSGWDWIVGKVFPGGVLPGTNEAPTLEDLLLRIGVRLFAVFKGITSAAGGAISDVYGWVVEQVTGKTGTGGQSGIFDANGDQLMGGTGAPPSTSDIIVGIGARAEAFFKGVFEGAGNAISDLYGWIRGKVGQGGSFGPNGSMDPARGYVAQGGADDIVASIGTRAEAIFRGLFDAAGGAIGDVVGWIKGKVTTGPTFGPNGSADPARGASSGGDLSVGISVDGIVSLLGDLKEIATGFDAWFTKQVNDKSADLAVSINLKLDEATGGKDGAYKSGEQIGNDLMAEFIKGVTAGLVDPSAGSGGGSGGGSDLSGVGSLILLPLKMKLIFDQFLAGVVVGSVIAIGQSVAQAVKNATPAFRDAGRNFFGAIKEDFIGAFTAGDTFSGSGGSDLSGLDSRSPGGGGIADKITTWVNEQLNGIGEAWETFKTDLGKIFSDAIPSPTVTLNWDTVPGWVTDAVGKIAGWASSIVDAWHDFWSDTKAAEDGPGTSAPMGQDFGFGTGGTGVGSQENKTGGDPHIFGPDGKSAPIPTSIEAGVKFVPDTKSLNSVIQSLDKDYDVDVKVNVDSSGVTGPLAGLFGGGGGGRPKLDALSGGADVTVKIGADSSAFTAAMNSAVLAGATFQGQTWTTKLNANAGQFTMTYTSTWMAGQAFDAQTWTATFDLDNAPAMIVAAASFEIGRAWDVAVYTGDFNGNNVNAMQAAAASFDIGRAWDGQVFTASFSIDTSGITAAVGVARQAAADIAAVMPHSPADEGPLREPITFDYIGQEMESTAARMITAAERGAAGVKSALGGNVWSDSNIGLGSNAQQVTVHNNYIFGVRSEEYATLLSKVEHTEGFVEGFVDDTESADE